MKLFVLQPSNFALAQNPDDTSGHTLLGTYLSTTLSPPSHTDPSPRPPNQAPSSCFTLIPEPTLSPPSHTDPAPRPVPPTNPLHPRTPRPSGSTSGARPSAAPSSPTGTAGCRPVGSCFGRSREGRLHPDRRDHPPPRPRG